MSTPSLPAPWTRFEDAHPYLRQHIEVRVDIASPPLDMGCIRSLGDNGGWLLLDGDKDVGVSVQPDYEWRVRQ